MKKAFGLLELLLILIIIILISLYFTRNSGSNPIQQYTEYNQKINKQNELINNQLQNIEKAKELQYQRQQDVDE